MSDDRDALRAWLALLGASNALKKSVDTRFRSRFGLSISRFDVLSALDRAGPEGERFNHLAVGRVQFVDHRAFVIVREQAPIWRNGEPRNLAQLRRQPRLTRRFGRKQRALQALSLRWPARL